MNVLILSHLFPNRRETLKGVFVAEYTRALARQAAVQVVAPLPVLPWLRPFDGIPLETKLDGLRVLHPRFLAMPGPLARWRGASYRRALRKVEARLPDPVDVLHVHWVYPDAFAAMTWAKERSLRMIVTVHGHEAYGAFATPAIQRRHREALQAAQHVIAVSDEIRNRLVEALGLDPRRVTTIHNGIDVQKFPLQAREDARRNLGLPVNKRLLLTVARLSPEKRLDLLIDAAAACDRQLDWQFHIVGEGPEHARLQRQIAGLGLQNRILLERGVPHEQLVDWYRSADVFCLSSRNEGCPVVVIEALACGVPVVSTAVGAVPDLVSEPDEGLLCPAGDVAALTQRIGQALRSDWNHERIAERGRQRTWDAVVAQTLPLYHPSGD